GYALAPRVADAVLRQVHRTPPPETPPPPGTKWVEVKTTGYCPCPICCGKDSDGRTSLNRDVLRFPYGIAVEPKLIPYRQWLNVPGYGEHMVDDTGGAMRQSAKKHTVHLDLRFKTHQQARRWGVRWLWIAIPEAAPAAKYGYPKADRSGLGPR
nr:3D domain-containing protein [Planctomycetota bacterium]